MGRRAVIVALGLLALGCDEEDAVQTVDLDASTLACAIWNPPPCTCGDGAPGRAVCGPDSGIAGCTCDGGPFDAYIKDAAIPDAAPPARRFDAAPVVDAAPPECDEGETREAACPEGSDGRVTWRCSRGRWGQCGGCLKACDEGARETRPCDGGLAAAHRECVDGAWSLWSRCDDGGACAEGEVDADHCGPGVRRRACDGGRWGRWGRCEDASACPDGSRPPCAVNGRRCPEGIASTDASRYLVGDIASLWGDGFADGPGCVPQYFEWVVLARPPGSTSQPVERYFNPAHPADGGPADRIDSPSAFLFLDRPGTFDVELRVTDADGLTSPSAACPARRAWVRITAEPAP